MDKIHNQQGNAQNNVDPDANKRLIAKIEDYANAVRQIEERRASDRKLDREEFDRKLTEAFGSSFQRQTESRCNEQQGNYSEALKELEQKTQSDIDKLREIVTAGFVLLLILLLLQWLWLSNRNRVDVDTNRPSASRVSAATLHTPSSSNAER